MVDRDLAEISKTHPAYLAAEEPLPKDEFLYDGSFF